LLANFNKILINIYLIVMLLSIYMPIKESMLYLLVLMNTYFFIQFLIYLKKENFKINMYLLIVFSSLIISIVMSGKYFYYSLVNLLVISAIYYIVEFDFKYLLDRLRIYIFISTAVNFYFYFTLKPDYSGAKVVSGILIERVQLDFLPLSITSILALLTFVLSDSLRSKLLVYTLKFMSILLIIHLGKLSVIATLLLTYSSFFLLKLFYNKTTKYYMNTIYIGIYVLIYIFVFLLFIFGDSMPPEIIQLLTLRDQIYSAFIQYSLDNNTILFGNGYINNFTYITDLTTSAHNQYLNIFFILGIFGYIVFIIFFIKILLNTLHGVEKGSYMPFKVFFSISLLMTMDNYFILTVFPLTMIFMLLFLLKLSPSKTNYNNIGVFK